MSEGLKTEIEIEIEILVVDNTISGKVFIQSKNKQYGATTPTYTTESRSVDPTINPIDAVIRDARDFIDAWSLRHTVKDSEILPNGENQEKSCKEESFKKEINEKENTIRQTQTS